MRNTDPCPHLLATEARHSYLQRVSASPRTKIPEGNCPGASLALEHSYTTARDRHPHPENPSPDYGARCRSRIGDQ
ncbi:hypothetical protein CEP53_004345 [Fusarium sp. AF-6]|nr:hypothetical protein CEP53_004345 [Fusarium sp. AF-6]